MKELKFFKCAHCGNIVVKLVDKGTEVLCCGENMLELKANSVDASLEKHTPVVDRQNNLLKVSVGSVLHPMTEEHSINFIVLQTNLGVKIVNLTAQDKPEATFVLQDNEEIKNVFEYCNLHGLWVLN